MLGMIQLEQMLGKYQLVDSGNDTWAGYDLKKGEIVNMKGSRNY